MLARAGGLPPASAALRRICAFLRRQPYWKLADELEADEGSARLSLAIPRGGFEFTRRRSSSPRHVQHASSRAADTTRATQSLLLLQRVRRWLRVARCQLVTTLASLPESSPRSFADATPPSPSQTRCSQADMRRASSCPTQYEAMSHSRPWQLIHDAMPPTAWERPALARRGVAFCSGHSRA